MTTILKQITMKKNKYIICSLVFGLFTAHLFAQGPEEMLDYLKKNIKIFYQADPDADDPEFIEILPASIASSKGSVVFGTKNNNSMESGAKLLLDLFKTSGDTKLQETVYYAMQIKASPLRILFVNDAARPVQETTHGFYHLERKKRIGIWPGVFSRIQNDQFSPDIIMGEYLMKGAVSMYLTVKEVLIEMIVKWGLRDFGPAKKNYFDVFDDMTSGNVERKIAFPENAVNRIALQAVADAFVFSYSFILQGEAINWIMGGGYSVLHRDYGLRNQFLKADAKLEGTTIKTKGIDINDNRTSILRLYYLGDFSGADMGAEKAFFRYDLYQGFIFSEFIRKAGYNNFLTALKFDNNKFRRSEPIDRVRILFENMCLVMLKGKKYANLPKSSGAPDESGGAFAMFLFDLYGPINSMTTVKSQPVKYQEIFEKIMGSKISTGEAQEIIPYYINNCEDGVQKVLKKVKTLYNEDTFPSRVNAVADLMKVSSF